MTQKFADLLLAHLVRMPFMVEENESANPLDVRLFRSNGIMFRAKTPTDAIQQFGRRRNDSVRGEHAQNISKQMDVAKPKTERLP